MFMDEYKIGNASGIEVLLGQNNLLLAFSQDSKCQRAAILNESCRPRIWTRSDPRNSQNAAAHGGNILADIQVIEEMEDENPTLAGRWKSTFFHLYELDFKDFRLPLQYAPAELIRTCNILATLRVRPWKLQSKKFKEKIIGKCKKIISAWSESLADVDNDFSLSADLRNEYKSIIDWYRNVGA
ncbi:hypothetical protein V8E54_007625 [Elaphomyces granulatus]